MSLPAGAALGTTSDPRELVRGDAARVAVDGAALQAESRRVGGLRDRVAAVRTPGWVGGLAQVAYESRRSAELEKWGVYVDLLETAGDALTTFSSALSTAQARAADAVARWEQGDAATATAAREHDAAVARWNEYVQRPVAVPTLGGPVFSAGAPPRPGAFHDPGQALRDEAQQILDDAREALEQAGVTAVHDLGGLPGGKSEGSSGSDASFDAEGPSFSWEGFSETFGRDPAEGKDGKYDPEGREDSPFKINIGSIAGQAKVWGAEGSYEDYYGDVKVGADGSVTLLGVDGKAEAHIGKDGLVLGAEARAILAAAEGDVSAELGPAAVGAHGEVFVGAEAKGDVLVGPQGVHANGEAFAGAKAGADVHGDVGGVGGKVGAEGWAGVGAAGDLDLGMKDGKFTIGGSGGLAFGLGGKVDGEVTLDFGKMAHTGGDIITGIGGIFQ